MPIDPTNNNVSRINGNPVSDVAKTKAERPIANTPSTPAASAQFRATHTADGSQDVDQARVADIRQAISDGKLEFHADRIADGIIASARELVSGSD